MDKYMKLKDIPKGQRWAHFKEYYKFQTFMAVFIGILLIILVKDMFFSEKYDITITEATTRYYSEEVMSEMDTMFTEHSRDYDYSDYPEFDGHRAYGSVNFTIFRKK